MRKKVRNDTGFDDFAASLKGVTVGVENAPMILSRAMSLDLPLERDRVRLHNWISGLLWGMRLATDSEFVAYYGDLYREWALEMEANLDAADDEGMSSNVYLPFVEWGEAHGYDMRRLRVAAETSREAVRSQSVATADTTRIAPVVGDANTDTDTLRDAVEGASD